ncbi:hypothetical protein [Sphingomonas sanguinis]|jgi:predicted lipid-binding transport protein (Tim44 family)|uniref:Uncharacterized protein n=1 Tax=Sphingomonas sanguinis TaxID=33051 RepID=A0A7Y7USH2_9SPHN|nr:hypothetical protein [Sphingomonas sanguinis]MBZ6383073.1 hypothetical protein [Sphingomonas sanguinis]NNG48199.1 hypothetical protein [Sphingomonas sanguinis]NNG54945.1 hypothetical protein [Sphingomonas sanguinis]NVP32370.1 hypothetical protein [Sphingomonas sanguinis]
MSLLNDQPERAVWFVYSRRAGKISAHPVSFQGWIALLVCILLVGLAGWAVSSWASAIHPILGFFALAAVIVIGVLLTIRLAIAKGRPA